MAQVPRRSEAHRPRRTRPIRESRSTSRVIPLGVSRTRSDSSVNLRTSSWNFPLGLSVKYPINDKFYVTSNTGYLRRTYSDASLALVKITEVVARAIDGAETA